MNLDFQKLVYLLPIQSLRGLSHTLMNGVSLPRPCTWVRPVFLSALASVCWYVMWKGQPGFSTSQSGEKITPTREVSVHVKDVNCNKQEAQDRQGFKWFNCRGGKKIPMSSSVQAFVPIITFKLHFLEAIMTWCLENCKSYSSYSRTEGKETYDERLTKIVTKFWPTLPWPFESLQTWDKKRLTVQ